VGFDWNSPLDALKKVAEESEEFTAELNRNDADRAFEEWAICFSPP
jgi:phosphoribosyl-ATP pyrophosphohydrolase